MSTLKRENCNSAVEGVANPACETDHYRKKMDTSLQISHQYVTLKIGSNLEES